MFTIKGRKYNIEYEGLHMLCTVCGRYGHYKEGCPDKAKAAEGSNSGKEGDDSSKETNCNLAGSNVEGPWRVVQKTRRPRKVNPGKNGEKDTVNATPAAAITAKPAKLNNFPNSTGSRFISLLEDTAELEKEGMINGENLMVLEEEGEVNLGASQREHVVANQKAKNKRVNSGVVNKKGEGVTDRIYKEPKLATRGSSFKGKSGAHGKKGVDSIMDKVGVDLLEKSLGHDKQPNFNNLTNIEEVTNAAKNVTGPRLEERSVPLSVNNPNVPRPPNRPATPPIFLSPILTPVEGEQIGEGDVFVDANDQGSVGSQESDMEVVVETMSLS
jgi:hypothetical protein